MLSHCSVAYTTEAYHILANRSLGLPDVAECFPKKRSHLHILAACLLLLGRLASGVTQGMECNAIWAMGTFVQGLRIINTVISHYKSQYSTVHYSSD